MAITLNMDLKKQNSNTHGRFPIFFKTDHSLPPKVSHGLLSKKKLKSGAARNFERNIVCTPHSKVSLLFKRNEKNRYKTAKQPFAANN